MPVVYSSNGGLNLTSQDTSVAQYIGPIASRSALPDSFASNNSTSNMKSCTVHEFYESGNTIQLVYSTLYGASTNELGLGNGTFSFTAFITYKGQSAWIQQTRKSGNFGTNLVSDFVTLPFSYKLGESFTITSYLMFTSTDARYPYFSDGLNYQFPNSGEACQTSSTALTELTLGETITNNAFQNIIYRPTAILGYTKKDTALIIGDSKNRGGGGNNTNMLTNYKGINGEIARVLDSKGIAYINIASSGDDYFTATQAGKISKRAEFAQYCSFVIDGYGINDLGLGTTTAFTCSSTSSVTVTGISPSTSSMAVGQVITGTNIYPQTTIASIQSTSAITLSKAPAAAITSFTLVPALTATSLNNYIGLMKTALGATNKPYLKSCMTPRAANAGFTTSAHRVTFSTAQAVPASEPLRRLWNNAIRGGQLNIDGYIDLCPAVETGVDTGLQIYGPGARNISDGAITSGTNLLSSNTANFTEADTGGMVQVIGAGASGADLVAQMIYQSPTTVLLVLRGGYQRVAANNASTTVSLATCYLHYLDYTRDGLHYTGLGEDKMAKDGNTSQLNKFIS
jgi:hypothetical protein